ncbi:MULTISPECIES: SLC13 family permease [unclassified Clostridioides]|uniref:SLC13 family permease n=1 Tax=unclassified Clostridioides TaxID=2635829 RepID=UPI001D0FE930|nr:SLC13 family permease [Clostridioides sp. ZZV14-6150]MCC0658752.1 SLC13 family permease [Clostridioides sp. ZZV14-6154]MCC0668776.1 SLC13 family permease [Clostridioides sp. ZZV14-6153]MCC0718498.1 SLC13 family permease [Clostridioides sp. ZZV14-6105]MCC0721748.1 SLC13 family permease [Clostridioides sp. ZZV14-6104]MCC0727141.1 SLC13 family permease [Clostridioides sp. ZZV14-6045]MCC0731751.1 SLC13 family permease [Clostridioides sp. ZZV14-6048]MCC0733629.1 SLC13 family permease [Clostrid
MDIILKPKQFCMTIMVTIILYFFLNYSFNIKFSICLSFLTILIWAVDSVEKTVVALVFVILAFIFNIAPLSVILQFLFTENFYIIILAYIITNAVAKTGVAKIISEKLILNTVDTPKKMIFLSYILGVLLIFFIPQPFPRVILVSAFYKEFFKEQHLTEDSKSILLFSIFTASTFTSMFFVNGDTLLNYVVLELGNCNINWSQWAFYMSVPTIITCFITYFLFIFVFKKELSLIKFVSCDNLNSSKFQFSYSNLKKEFHLLSDEQKHVFLCLGIMFFMFLTQFIHNLNTLIIMSICVLLLLLKRIIGFNTLKEINWKVLIFFIAAFSIGGVLKYSGVVDIMGNYLIKLIPNSSKTISILFLITLTIVLNICLGSAVTTSSVVIPLLGSLHILKENSIVLCLFVYIVVSIQYILPFHHATIMVGHGENLYNSKVIFKYGLTLIPLTYFIIICITFPWWRFIGLEV